jgi:putative permease
MDAKLQAILKRERFIKITSVISLLLMGAIVLLAVPNLLLSFLLAFVVAYLLAPIVNVLERRGLSRQTAIMLPFIATGLLIGFGIYKILPLITQQANLLESQLPKYQVDLMGLVDRTETRFKGFFKVYDIHFGEAVSSWMVSKSAGVSRAIPAAVSASLTVLILTPFFAFFMLQDGRRFSRSLLSLVPNNLFELALNLQHRLNDQFGGFIRARFLEAAIVGLVVWLGLQASGFPYAALLGLFAGVTNLIPYVGPLIGAVPAVLIALISDDAMITHTMSINLIIVTSIYFFAQLIDMAFIIPLVVARIVNLHPVTVVIVIIIGSQLMGILGMVISIPVASALKLILSTLYEHVTEFRT